MGLSVMGMAFVYLKMPIGLFHSVLWTEMILDEDLSSLADFIHHPGMRDPASGQPNVCTAANPMKRLLI